MMLLTCALTSLHCPSCLPHACSLIANSTLISRYAVLRAQALGLPAAAQLYGPSLTLAEPTATAAAAGGGTAGTASSSSSSRRVVGEGALYDKVAELELRLSGTLGIEVGVISKLDVIHAIHAVW
jgi:hypothetical protein